MKLLQWNVWYQEDIDNILSTIRAVKPDILCLQELTTNFAPQKQRHTAEYLAEKLGMHCFFKAARETIDANGTHGFGNAIISRFPIISAKSRFIRRRNAREKAADDLAEPRVYLEATLNVSGERLTVGTTHMSYTAAFRQTAAKRAEADKLLSILQTKRRRFMIGGDFNALPRSYTIRTIGKHLRNAGPPYKESTWTTKPFSYGGFAANTRDWRIDYCFATPDIRVTSARIVETPYSDHLPLLVEFDF
jgi:endonuclease/exonuclease/phosphatase family metal-dependent hydrolase